MKVTSLQELRMEIAGLHRKLITVEQMRNELEAKTGTADLKIYREINEVKKDIEFVEKQINEITGGDCA